MSKNLLIVAHAPSGNTERMVASLLEGARSVGTQRLIARKQAALQTTVQDVLCADGIILFTPENLGYMSGALKDFFDRVYYPVLEQKQGLPCAVVIRAGHDGTGTRRAIDGILTGLRWQQVQEAMVCRGVWQDDFLEQCHELGQAFAAGLEAGIF